MNLLEAFSVEIIIAGCFLVLSVLYLFAARMVVVLGPRMRRRRAERMLAELSNSEAKQESDEQLELRLGSKKA